MLRPLLKFTAVVLLAVAGVIGQAAESRAADPNFIGAFRDWSAFWFDENGSRVCYMASQPKRDEGDYTRRGDIYVLVTQRPAENSLDVISFIAGYTYQQGSEVTVQIGSNSFRLFTDGDTAWARDAATDRALVNAMKAGSTMVVRGTSSRGTATTDTYSLSGATAAYNAINENCGITR